MSLINESKKIIEAGSEQASFQLDIVKKKLKIYGIQKKIEIEMAGLGEMLYHLFQEKEKDIYQDKQISEIVESINEEKKEIGKTEQEIIDIQSDSNGAKDKLCSSGKSLFDTMKRTFSQDPPKIDDEIRVEQPQSIPPVDTEQEKEEVKQEEKPDRNNDDGDVAAKQQP